MRSSSPGTAPSEKATEHRSIAAVRAALSAAGATGEIRVFTEPVRTAALAAAALGCQVGAIANSLVFDADGSPVLILTSGAHRVNTDTVAASIGVGALARATPEFVRAHTGQAIGGVAPVGHPAPVPTYLDAALGAHPVIWAAAGHPGAVFDTDFSELQRITDAEVIDVQ